MQATWPDQEPSTTVRAARVTVAVAPCGKSGTPPTIRPLRKQGRQARRNYRVGKNECMAWCCGAMSARCSRPQCSWGGLCAWIGRRHWGWNVCLCLAFSCLLGSMILGRRLGRSTASDEPTEPVRPP